MLSRHGSPSLIGCAFSSCLKTQSVFYYKTIWSFHSFFTSMTNGIHRWAPPSYLLFTMFLKMVIYRSMKSMETIPKHQHHILPKIISRYLVEDNNPNKSMPLHFFVIKTEMCATLPSKNNNLCPLTQGYISDTWQY